MKILRKSLSVLQRILWRGIARGKDCQAFAEEPLVLKNHQASKSCVICCLFNMQKVTADHQSFPLFSTETAWDPLLGTLPSPIACVQRGSLHPPLGCALWQEDGHAMQKEEPKKRTSTICTVELCTTQIWWCISGNRTSSLWPREDETWTTSSCVNLSVSAPWLA